MPTTMPRSMTILPLVLLLPLLLIAQPAAAEWSHDIFENDSIYSSDRISFNPVTVTDGLGGLYVVWQQETLDNAIYSLQAQHIDADGTFLWGHDGITLFTPDASLFTCAHAAADNNGDLYVGFIAEMLTGNEVYAQRVRSDGVLPWGPEAREAMPGAYGTEEEQVVVAADGIDGCILAWQVDGDIYAQRIAPNGEAQWLPYGYEVCGQNGNQHSPQIASDGNGGAYVVWTDGRQYPTNFNDIYAQQMDSDGTRLLTYLGVAIDDSSDQQGNPFVVSDGLGGFIVAWEDENGGNHDIQLLRFSPIPSNNWSLAVADESSLDQLPRLCADGYGGCFVAWSDNRPNSHIGSDIFVQWVDTSGHQRWTYGGMPAGIGDWDQTEPWLCTDGAGGLIVTWLDYRSGNWPHPYAQRVNTAGTPMWTSTGVELSAAPGSKESLTTVPDEHGGMVAVWHDYRNGSKPDIFGQRIGFHGFLGDATPSIDGLVDHPQDQGGVMLLDWDPSYLDSWQYDSLEFYSVWRQFAGVGKAASPEVALVVEKTGLDPDVVQGLFDRGWVYDSQVEAHKFDQYTALATTFGDDSPDGTPLTQFKVLAHWESVFWESDVAEGYSIDNLAPGAPLTLTAAPDGADIDLAWGAAGFNDEDLAHYRVYRGDASGFPLDPAHFLSDAPDSLFTDPAPGPGQFYYRVTGVDIHGNEGDPSNEADALSISAVGNELPATVALVGNHPNPFNPSTTIAFDLPARMTVRLEIFAADGRRVAVPHEGPLPAGRRQVVWQGRDSDGRRLPSGSYIYQLSAGEMKLKGRMTLLK